METIQSIVENIRTRTLYIEIKLKNGAGNGGSITD
jgi:hypothetical protein